MTALLRILFAVVLSIVTTFVIKQSNPELNIVPATLVVLVSILLTVLVSPMIAVSRSTTSRPASSASSTREFGAVKWFNAKKGFGFITQDNGQDVFVHFRSIEGSGRRILKEGQRVSFDLVNEEKGLQAEHVELIN